MTPASVALLAQAKEERRPAVRHRPPAAPRRHVMGRIMRARGLSPSRDCCDASSSSPPDGTNRSKRFRVFGWFFYQFRLTPFRQSVGLCVKS